MHFILLEKPTCVTIKLLNLSRRKRYHGTIKCSKHQTISNNFFFLKKKKRACTWDTYKIIIIIIIIVIVIVYCRYFSMYYYTCIQYSTNPQTYLYPTLLKIHVGVSILCFLDWHVISIMLSNTTVLCNCRPQALCPGASNGPSAESCWWTYRLFWVCLCRGWYYTPCCWKATAECFKTRSFDSG